ncbi:MAG: hypothetical protein ACTHYM_01720 [Actinomycetaceae bacterium]
MRSRLSAVVLPGLAVLALAACSSTDDPTAAPISAPVAPAPAAPAGGAPAGEAPAAGDPTTPAAPAPPPAPGPTTEPAPPSNPAPPEGADVGLSREDAAPLDTPVRVGDWMIEVGATDVDATQAVADENMFNSPPDDGFDYVLLPVTATYLGTERVNPWLELHAEFVGNDATTYDGYCGVVPDAFLNTNDVYEGGTVTGNFCAPVRVDAIEGGVWLIEEQMNFEDVTTRYFAVS